MLNAKAPVSDVQATLQQISRLFDKQYMFTCKVHNAQSKKSYSRDKPIGSGCTNVTNAFNMHGLIEG